MLVQGGESVMLNDLLKIFKKPNKRDWAKSDQILIDNFYDLRKRQKQNEELMIQSLDQSTYKQRKFSGGTNPDYVGPMTGSPGTKDRMPGTTPSSSPNPRAKGDRLIKPKHEKYPGYI